MPGGNAPRVTARVEVQFALFNAVSVTVNTTAYSPVLTSEPGVGFCVMLKLPQLSEAVIPLRRSGTATVSLVPVVMLAFGAQAVITGGA